jgi:hypothetical protein
MTEFEIAQIAVELFGKSTLPTYPQAVDIVKKAHGVGCVKCKSHIELQVHAHDNGYKKGFEDGKKEQ